MSSVVDPEDRATAVLCGDGAGTVLIEAVEDESVGILDHVFHMDGEGETSLYIPAAGASSPPAPTPSPSDGTTSCRIGRPCSGRRA